MQKFSARLTFTTELLGGAPLNAEVYSDYIASKAPATLQLNGQAAAEVQTIETIDLKGRTGFHRSEKGEPMILDYVVRGFCKEAWRACRQMPDTYSKALTNGVSKIDSLLFVAPRYIILHLPPGGKEDVLERPLRASTAQGPRVALAASEQLPVGTWCDVQLTSLAPTVITENLLREWLDYGQYMGIGQWRGGSFGRFVVRGGLKPWQPAA